MSARHSHLLVALDDSEGAQQALSHAVAWAAQTGAQLTLLHVVQPWGYVTGFESAMAALDEMRPLMREAGEKMLAQGCTQALAQGVKAKALLWLPGQAAPRRPWDIIDQEAREAGADLVVLGRGGTGAGRAHLGPVAEQMLRHASLPVLLVGRPG